MVDVAELFGPASADVNAADEGDGDEDDGDHAWEGGLYVRPPDPSEYTVTNPLEA